MVKIIIEHDDDCPLGVNGLRAYHEAREAFASTPPEARSTSEDKAALAMAQYELEQKQVCTCGAAELPNLQTVKRPRGTCGKQWIESLKIFCQLPASHIGEHWSEVSRDDGNRTAKAELYWKDGKPIP